MATVLNVATAAESDKEIEPLALPLADPLGKQLQTKTLNIFSSTDGTIDAGIWETVPGRSRWEFTENGEIIYIISGTMIVQRDSEEPQTVGAGDLVVFEPGWTGYWEVTQELQKVYVIFE